MHDNFPWVCVFLGFCFHFGHFGDKSKNAIHFSGACVMFVHSWPWANNMQQVRGSSLDNRKHWCPEFQVYCIMKVNPIQCVELFMWDFSYCSVTDWFTHFTYKSTFLILQIKYVKCSLDHLVTSRVKRFVSGWGFLFAISNFHMPVYVLSTSNLLFFVNKSSIWFEIISFETHKLMSFNECLPLMMQVIPVRLDWWQW